MAPIIVAFDATEVAIPKEPGAVILSVEFRDYRDELVCMRLSRFENTTHLLSRLTSRPGQRIAPPYRQQIAPLDELNRRLDVIHQMAFGDGGWLNLERSRDNSDGPSQPADEQPSDDEASQQADEQPGDDKASQQADEQPSDGEAHEQYVAVQRHQANQLVKEIRDFFSTQPNNIKPDNVNKKRKSGIMSKARKLRKKLNDTRFSDDQAKETVQSARDTLIPTACAAAVVDTCKLGMELLHVHVSSGETTTPIPRQFADLFKYQRTRREDHGGFLADIFDEQQKAIKRVKKESQRAWLRRNFEVTTLAESARIVDRAYSHHYDRGYEYEWHRKRKENRTWAQNWIMNMLYQFKGADAWVFFACLRARGSLIWEMGRMQKDRTKGFLDQTSQRLREFEFENFPDDTPIFHFLAWLAWLLRKT